jgi:hypothetical protein
VIPLKSLPVLDIAHNMLSSLVSKLTAIKSQHWTAPVLLMNV